MTIAATYRETTRPASASDSPRPKWVVWVSTMIGLPPSSAMPTSNDTRVRRLGLSKSTATDLRPASGRCPNRSAFIAGGQVEHRALLGRRQVVVAEEVPGHRPPVQSAAVSAPSAARNASACSAVRISGGASRMTSGLQRR